MKVDFAFLLEVSEEAWAERAGIDPARVGLDVVGYLSDAMWWLTGLADTDAVLRWKKDPRPRERVDGVSRQWCRVVVEVSAGRWQEWAGIPAGRVRGDLIEYVTYQVERNTGLAEVGAKLTWRVKTYGPVGADENELPALLWRWPSMRESE